jgi:hypothetical protein
MGAFGGFVASTAHNWRVSRRTCGVAILSPYVGKADRHPQFLKEEWPSFSDPGRRKWMLSRLPVPTGAAMVNPRCTLMT